MVAAGGDFLDDALALIGDVEIAVAVEGQTLRRDQAGRVDAEVFAAAAEFLDIAGAGAGDKDLVVVVGDAGGVDQARPRKGRNRAIVKLGDVVAQTVGDVEDIRIAKRVRGRVGGCGEHEAAQSKRRARGFVMATSC
ncbi:MAG: hypothetical protein WDO13_16895 [Verrucomicrobiota bacterium]